MKFGERPQQTFCCGVLFGYEALILTSKLFKIVLIHILHLFNNIVLHISDLFHNVIFHICHFLNNIVLSVDYLIHIALYFQSAGSKLHACFDGN